MNDFDDSVDAARRAADRDDLSRWIGEFLRSPGSDNAPLADDLESKPLHWTSPVRVDFDELHRLAGPPDQPTLDELDDDDLERVEDMEDSIEDDDWQPPPVIASYRNGQLVVEDGNHRIEGLRRAGHDSYWSVVGFEDARERDRFEAEQS